MNRRQLLRGLAVGSVMAAVAGCTHERKPRSLKVVLNGPFGVVFEGDKPAQVTAFVPFEEPTEQSKEPAALHHQFYFNDLTREMKTDTHYNFRLEERGIRKNRFQRPYIDRCFNDFNKKTDRWVMKNYFLTIVLPVPDIITFTGPAEVVTFAQTKRQGVMPLNAVFEYTVDDMEDVRSSTENVSDKRPVSGSKLRDQYQKHCATYKTPGCSDMMDFLSDDEDGNGMTFFFGVGVSSDASGDSPKQHALNFFNNNLLSSFPSLQESLKLADIDGPIVDPTQTAPRGNTQSGMLVPAVWRESMSPRLLQVSAVIDCQVGIVMGHIPPK